MRDKRSDNPEPQLIRVLYDKLDIALERVRQLENELGINAVFPMTFRLTRSEESILGVLMARRMASYNALMLGLYSNRIKEVKGLDIVKVFVFKLRRKLKVHGITIKNHHDIGYSISDEDKATLKRVAGII